jgi:hypothetical protein
MRILWDKELNIHSIPRISAVCINYRMFLWLFVVGLKAQKKKKFQKLIFQLAFFVLKKLQLVLLLFSQNETQIWLDKGNFGI